MVRTQNAQSGGKQVKEPFISTKEQMEGAYQTLTEKKTRLKLFGEGYSSCWKPHLIPKKGTGYTKICMNDAKTIVFVPTVLCTATKYTMARTSLQMGRTLWHTVASINGALTLVIS